MALLQRIRASLTQVLRLSASPHQIALAFAVGVFIAFAPIYPHTILVVFCVWALRLNLVALLIGASINNPMTIVPILGTTLWTGFQLMGLPEIPNLHWGNLSPLALYEQIRPYVMPFVVGGTVLSLGGALLGYPAAYAFIVAYRERLARIQEESLPPETDSR